MTAFRVSGYVPPIHRTLAGRQREKSERQPKVVDLPGTAEVERVARAIHEAEHSTIPRTRDFSPSAWDARSVDKVRHTTTGGQVNVLEPHHRNHFRKIARVAIAAMRGR